VFVKSPVKDVNDSPEAQGEQIRRVNGTARPDPTMIPKFPENRENNREYFIISESGFTSL
jgi:hypothetical protein